MNRKRYKKKLVVRNKQEESYNKLLKKVEKNIKKTNQRLKSLEKKQGYSNVYASKNLKERLGSDYFKKGRLSLSKNLRKSNLIDIAKGTDIFLKSRTSTKKGINTVRINVKKGIKDMFEDNEKEILDEQADDYFEFLNYDAFTFFADKIGASLLWIIINNAIKNNDNLDTFIDRLNDYIEFGNDLDMRDRAIRLYDLFVK